MKKIFYVICWPLLFVVSQFFMTIVATLLFNASNHFDAHFLETEEYTIELAKFLSDYGILLLTLLFLIFFPLLYKKYHCEIKEEPKKIGIYEFVFLIVIGFSFSLLYNSILSSIHFIIPIPNLFAEKANILLGLIGTVLIGPILEEYLFRGIAYHRLQQYFSIMKSLLLTGFIFALFHQNIFQMIYAMIFNFILIFSYERFSTIKAPILVHMSGNLGGLLFSSILAQNFLLREFTIVIASLLLIGSYIGLKEEHK